MDLIITIAFILIAVAIGTCVRKSLESLGHKMTMHRSSR